MWTSELAECGARVEGGNLSNRDLIGGFVRLHVLHHASSGPIFGIGIIERLALHGYVLSPGTLYPILHGLERDGFLRSRAEVVGKNDDDIRLGLPGEGALPLTVSVGRAYPHRVMLRRCEPRHGRIHNQSVVGPQSSQRCQQQGGQEQDDGAVFHRAKLL